MKRCLKRVPAGWGRTPNTGQVPESGSTPLLGGGGPTDLPHRSHRERFLRFNRDTRDTESARAVLASEWRYLGRWLDRLERPRVLDLACGSGPYSLAWAERGGEVMGVDFDRDLLAAARLRADGNPASRLATWVCGDATQLSLRSEMFDVVFCNSLLEHVPDWTSALAEMSRVLKPGGLAVVYTTNRHCPLQQEINHFPLYPWLPRVAQRRILGWIMEHRRDLVNFTDFPAIHWFSFPRMRRAFVAAGLEPWDRLDVAATGSAAGARRRVARVLHRWPALKWPYYFYAISMALYGVKGARTPLGAGGR